MDANVQKLRDWLAAHEDELVEATRAMLQVPSIEGEPAENAPYGLENRRALDLALQLSADAGMKTTDLEGHIGFADFGSGERLIMSLGHLDVVPVGPGWKYPPFGAEIDGGYIYARGSTDDKGPTMASFFAMRAIKECLPELNVRFRLVFGCNEESGFGCVERYVQTEEAPTFGVAPDSGWPLYHAEKGICDLVISVTPPESDFQLIEAEGGQRPNIVIDSFRARVKVGDAVRAEVEAKLASGWDKNTCATWTGDVLEIVAIGKAAHGAHPHDGDNAAVRGFRLIRDLAPLASSAFYDQLFNMGHNGGAGLGISGADEASKDLTCNLGIVSMRDGVLRQLFNIRYPVTWKGPDLKTRAEAKLGSAFTVVIERDSAPLYFPLDHPLVKTVVDVYEEETGERKAPGTMGGGTYARAVPNTVSIGTGWLGDGNAHETDERLAISSLHKMARIYAHILYRLAVLPD
jgi:succinyl-diaminopimelate desuccinylase